MNSYLFMVFNSLQLAVHKCMECGQPLPESYTPPADEAWMTGIFGCAEDRENCKLMHDQAVKCYLYRTSQIVLMKLKLIQCHMIPLSTNQSLLSKFLRI